MKKLLLIVLVAAMIFSTGFSAENSTNGITDDSVKIGTFQALSGAVAFIGVSMNKGMEAYFNWINENGGIYGRKIDLISVDDQFVPSKTVIEVKRLVEQDKVFAIVGGLGTPGCLAVMDYLNEGGVPFVYQGSGSSLLSIPPKKYIFSVQPNYSIEAPIVGKYLTEVANKKRIGMIYRAAEDGKEAYAALRAWLRENGKSDMLVRAIAVDPAQTSFDNEIIKMMQSGVDAVYLLTFTDQTPNILKQSRDYGFEPLFVSCYPNAEPKLIQLAEGAAEGMEAMAWVDLNDPEAENYLKYMDIFQATYPDEIPDAYAAAGFIAAELFTEGLRRAGENPTRESLVEGLESLNGWQGIITPIITYYPYDPENEKARLGLNAMYILRVEGDQMLKAVDWVKMGE
jgi:branched-chain amino acid transport system substrate-binding protein